MRSGKEEWMGVAVPLGVIYLGLPRISLWVNGANMAGKGDVGDKQVV